MTHCSHNFNVLCMYLLVIKCVLNLRYTYSYLWLRLLQVPVIVEIVFLCRFLAFLYCMTYFTLRNPLFEELWNPCFTFVDLNSWPQIHLFNLCVLFFLSGVLFLFIMKNYVNERKNVRSYEYCWTFTTT